MHGLGCLYYSLDDYDKDEEFLRKALEIFRMTMSEFDPFIQNIVSRLQSLQ